MGMTRLGHCPLSALLTRGIFRGDQAQKLPQFSWALKTCQGTHFRHQSHSHRTPNGVTTVFDKFRGVAGKLKEINPYYDPSVLNEAVKLL